MRTLLRIKRERDVIVKKTLFLTQPGLIAAGWAALGSAALAADMAVVTVAEPVTVYGSRIETQARSLPATVTVIAREAIELAQPGSVNDMIADVPGVQISGGPRRTGESPAIRGLGGQRVLILIDGAPQTFTSAHDGRFFVDPELLRSIEVLRGPASALYGSGALGGVIALRSASASDFLSDGQAWGARLRASHASGNAETVASATVFGQSGGLDGLASLGWRDSGDITLGGGRGDLQSDDDILTGLVKARIRPAPGLSIEASLQSFRNQAVEPNNGQGVIVADPILAALVDKDVTSHTLRASLGWRPPGGRLIDLSITPYAVTSEVDELDRAMARGTLREIETHGVTVQNIARFGGPERSLDLVVGGDWREDEQVGRDTAGAGGVREGVPNGSSRFGGAFAEARVTLPAPLGLPGTVVLSPAVRWDRFENEATGQPRNTADATSPKLGALWQPSEALSLFVAWGEGFRAPSINELYLTGLHFRLPHPILGARAAVSNLFVPNPALRPEQAEGLEAGLTLVGRDLIRTGDEASLRLAAYRSDVDDLIDLSVNVAFPASCFRPPFQPCDAGTTASANIARARLEGAEAEARYEDERIALSAVYSETRGRNRATNAFLGVLAPRKLTLDGRMKFPGAGVVAGMRVRAADDFTSVNRAADRRDGYAVADFYARWRPATGPLSAFTVSAAVENAGNTLYERAFAGVPEPGRTVKISLSWAGAAP